ncbi:MAG: hypothetical protein GY754_30630 [bacterium]|nr:hypothetical protein [bacterium]
MKKSKKIDDSKLYFYFGIVTLVLAIIVGSASFYSILMVEPEVDALLKANENTGANVKKAYLILRNPQVFAKYEKFDSKEKVVHATLKDFDKMIYNGDTIPADNHLYMYSLLKRRQSGSRLGRNTMSFLLLLSVISWLFFIYEKKQQVE